MLETKRRGKGVFYRETTSTGTGTREVTGFMIDNLDTKLLDKAENNYEKLFILVRAVLEENDASCMDVEIERLQCCQEIADVLRKNLLIK